MIIATRGDGIFLSSKLGVINLDKETHGGESVDSALRLGYWENVDETDPQFKQASTYEETHA